MTLGRCPLSIFCSRGTPPRPSLSPVKNGRKSCNSGSKVLPVVFWMVYRSVRSCAMVALAFSPVACGLQIAGYRNVKRFRGGLVYEAHRLLYHSTLGLRVIKKKKVTITVWGLGCGVWGLGFGVWGLLCGGWGLGFGVSGVGFGE